ncbi:hypothetical protein ACTOJ1_001666 [Shigella flexneri]
MDKKQENLLKNLFNYMNDLFIYDSEENKQKCLYPGCNNRAIKSHLYSRAAMEHLSDENSQVMSNYRKLTREENQEIPSAEKISIRKASRFWAFCNSHDTNLFKSFESQYGKTSLFKTSEQLSDYAYRTMVYYQYNNNKQKKVKELIVKKIEKLGLTDLNIDPKTYLDSEDLRNGDLNLKNIKEYLENPSEVNNNMKHFVIHLNKSFMFNNNILFNHLVLNNIFTFLSFFEDNLFSEKEIEILNFKNFWMVHNILSVENGMYILFTWDKNKEYSKYLENIMIKVNENLSNQYFKENFLSYLFSFNLNYPDKIVYSEKINHLYTYAEKRVFLNNMNLIPYSGTKFYICRNIKRNLILPGHSPLFKESKIIKSFIL